MPIVRSVNTVKLSSGRLFLLEIELFCGSESITYLGNYIMLDELSYEEDHVYEAPPHPFRGPVWSSFPPALLERVWEHLVQQYQQEHWGEYFRPLQLVCSGGEFRSRSQRVVSRVRRLCGWLGLRCEVDEQVCGYCSCPSRCHSTHDHEELWCDCRAFCKCSERCPGVFYRYVVRVQPSRELLTVVSLILLRHGLRRDERGVVRQFAFPLLR